MQKHIDIKKFLPHRAPMLMVDYITDFDEDTVKTIFKIESNCIFVSDETLSECGLIENAAQTCSSIVGKSYFAEDDFEGLTNDVIGFISVIKSINIYSLPIVTQTLTTKANLVSRFDTDSYSICTIKCIIENDTTVLADCEMNLFIQEV